MTIEELETWLRNHDYIGIKIATGRATIEDYADVIAEMTEKADRLEQLLEMQKEQETPPVEEPAEEVEEKDAVDLSKLAIYI